MVKKNKVLFISHEASLTGAPKSFLSFISRINETNKLNIRILIRSDGVLAKSFKRCGPTYVYYKHYRKQNIIHRLKHLVERPFRKKCIEFALFRHWCPDLIYSNTSLNTEFLAMADEYEIPVITHVQEMPGFIKSLNKDQIDSFLSVPDFYITVSDTVKDGLINEFSISKDKMQVVRHFIDPDDISRKAHEISGDRLRSDLDIGKDAIVVGGSGYLNKIKGPDIFIDVAKDILMKCPEQDIVFLWIGGKHSLVEAREILSAVGQEYNSRIQFIEQKQNPYPYFNIFDIFMCSSRFEAFGIVLLELAVLSKAMIYFEDSGGPKEFLARDCGYQVKNFDKNEMIKGVKELISSPDDRQRLGLNAHLHVMESYTGKTAGPEVVNIIERVIGS